jgi:hypothetical protein
MNTFKDMAKKIMPTVGDWASNIPKTVSLKSFHGKFLSAHPNGTAMWNSANSGKQETIFLETVNGGKFGLKSVYGKYLSAQPNGSVEWNRDKLDAWETWTVEVHAKQIALKSCHGKYLSAQPDGRVEANRDVAKEWELFTTAGDVR